MIQKLLRVGSSAAVTIPKKSLKELGLKIGDEVATTIDGKRRIFAIMPKSKLSRADEKIAKLTVDFIRRYRKDLEILAR